LYVSTNSSWVYCVYVFAYTLRYKEQGIKFFPFGAFADGSLAGLRTSESPLTG
jgi:hypothetical protein